MSTLTEELEQAARDTETLTKVFGGAPDCEGYVRASSLRARLASIRLFERIWLSQVKGGSEVAAIALVAYGKLCGDGSVKPAETAPTERTDDAK